MLRWCVTVVLCTVGAAKEVPWVREVTCTENREVTLEVEVGEVAVEGVVRFKTRIYRVEGEVGFPSSTLRFKAGEGCRLRVANNLPGGPCKAPHGNGYHCPDTTSLHTHGMHVSPEEDDIDTHIEPGGEHTYSYDMPSYHLMGTHWYHAHHHGSTALQALGGLAGMLFVEPGENFKLPKDLKKLYDDPVVPPMMLNYLALGETSGEPSFFNFYTHKDLVNMYDPVTVPLDLQWEDAENIPNNGSGNFYVVNGVFEPEVHIVKGDATLLRLVHAGDGLHLCLELDDDEGLCTMTLLARDGVFHRTPYLRLKTIVLLQGTRVDVAINCNLPFWVRSKTVNLRATNTPATNPASLNTFSQPTMMRFTITQPSIFHRSISTPTSEVPLPHYLHSLMGVDVQIGGETNVTTISFDTSGDSGYSVNGVSWPGWGSPQYVEEFCIAKPYEMTLGRLSTSHNPDGPVMATAYHPYHQHINHLQVYDPQDNTGVVVRKGEWRDVVPAWGLVMRFRPVKYTGAAVVHCHLLQHEDNGMMSLMKLTQCDGVRYDTATTEKVVVTSNDDQGSEDSGSSAAGVVVLSLLVAGVAVLSVMLLKDSVPFHGCEEEECGDNLKSIEVSNLL